MLIYINGEFFDEDNAKISVFDRGFLYGDSIYEVTSTQNQNPVFLQEHLDRLWRSGDKLGLTPQWSQDELSAEIEKGIHKLGFPRQYIRIVITRGAGEISLDPSKSSGQNLVMIFKELPENPRWWYDKGVSLIVADVLRTPKSSVDPSIKSGNYLNNVMAMKEAKEKGAFDAVMLNGQGMVSECTTSNIWIVKDGIYYTPPLSAGLLGGITRSKLIGLLDSRQQKYQEKPFSKEELYQADEVFMTASTKELVPVISVDGKKIGQGTPGEMTKKLHATYKELVQSTMN